MISSSLLLLLEKKYDDRTVKSPAFMRDQYLTSIQVKVQFEVCSRNTLPNFPGFQDPSRAFYTFEVMLFTTQKGEV